MQLTTTFPVLMPLTEKRIADLILRYIAGGISPAEKQELMEGYVDLSPVNRLAFERLTNPGNLLNSLREYYAFMQEVDDNMEREFGPDDPEPFNPPTEPDPSQD